jgi:hypothetical protein
VSGLARAAGNGDGVEAEMISVSVTRRSVSRSESAPRHAGRRTLLAAAVLVGALGVGPVGAQQARPEAQPAQAPPQPPPRPTAMLPDRPQLEPKAVAILKAMSDRLAAARTMTFTATVTYEAAARTGQPLAYTTLSEVTVRRPDKLKVVTPGDGSPSEFYYDGRTMTAYAPGPGLVAVADAPPTIDAVLKAAYDEAAIYFPFSDLIVADPYGDVAPGLRLAFVIGQSRVVGGVLTDMVAVANDVVQVELWIGADDRLPRMVRATYFDEPGGFRHALELSDWRLDPPLPADAFASDRAAGAKRIEFANPAAAKPSPK